jgi:pyruvate,water dikinase
MSVIIQEMVDAEVSGVMFTGHMASGNPDIVVINSTFGLCSPVVSGEVNPDVYYIRKSDGKIVRKKIAKKDLICRMENKRFRQMDISGTALSLQESLTETLLEELLETGLAIEDHYKCLQDIEFAIDNQLYIVQARPLKIKKLAA